MSRAIRVEGDIAYVPLTKGHVAVIDAADVPLVDGRLWSALTSPRRTAVYAARVQQSAGRQKMVLMHRLLASAPDDAIVDHRDGDGLNNCRANLRLCSRSQNNLNTPLRRDNVSGLNGVSLDRRISRWRAEIQIGGLRKFLGHFSTAEDAHAAYCRAAAEFHGDFARSK